MSALLVSRNDKERVLIETSVNAVRVSIAVKQGKRFKGSHLTKFKVS